MRGFLGKSAFVCVFAVIAVAVSAGMLWHSNSAAAQVGEPVHAGKTAGELDILYYTCAMHPSIQLPNPGKCPICGMKLIPVKKDSGANPGKKKSMRELTLTPYAEELAQVETAEVVRKFVQAEVRMVGFVTYDETRVAYITAWVPGRIDKLYVDFTGTIVRKNDPMVYLYSPQLLSAQQELLQSIRAVRQLRASKIPVMRQTAEQTVEASREKLRLWGLTPAQIDAIIKRGKPSDHMTIMAPISGVVIHKNGLEGMYVQTGTQIYTVADLSMVWIQLEAYESDLPWIRLGQEVEFETKGYPGEVFKGKVAFIDPFFKEKTRTVQVRLDAPNLDGRLKPEMFVRAVLRATLAEGGKVIGEDEEKEKPPLVIPASAPLITGKRAVVYLALPDQRGTYVGREIVLGPRAGDYYLVESGLKEGDVVVTQGNFMIDSSLQIQAKPSMMTPEGGGGGGMAHQMGGKKEKAAPMKSMKKKPAAGGPLEAPEGFKRQLRDVSKLYDELSNAVKSKDLEKIKSAFSAFRAALHQMDASGLSGHPLMVWLELDMLLENDALIGSRAKKLKEAERAFAELTNDFNRVRRRFAFEQKKPIKKEAAEAAMQVPQAFQKQIGEVLEAYLGVQQALSEDQFNRAQEATKTLADVVGSVDMKLLKGETHVKWMKFFPNLQAALTEMAQAKDLETFRKCFALLSEAMVVVVKTFGIHPARTVYELRCPMAFNGQGAVWLQEHKEIRNPYFGEAVIGCGELTEIPIESAQGEHRHE